MHTLFCAYTILCIHYLCIHYMCIHYFVHTKFVQTLVCAYTICAYTICAYTIFSIHYYVHTLFCAYTICAYIFLCVHYLCIHYFCIYYLCIHYFVCRVIHIFSCPAQYSQQLRLSLMTFCMVGIGCVGEHFLRRRKEAGDLTGWLAYFPIWHRQSNGRLHKILSIMQRIVFFSHFSGLHV